MALTPSTMAPLGMPAPDFCLPDTDDKLVGLAGFADAPALLVAFIPNHCPYVEHIRAAFPQRVGGENVVMEPVGVGIKVSDPNRVAVMRQEKHFLFPRSGHEWAANWDGDSFTSRE